MDRGAVLLQGLQNKMKGWKPFMERATKSSVTFVTRAAGEFAVTARWKNKDGTDAEATVEFTKEKVFGPTLSLTPQAWTVQERPCDYSREVVRTILTARGVL